MTTLDNREKAFEDKYAHDEAMQFKAEARRNKLLGLWLAGEMGLDGAAADTYAKTLVMADLEEPGHEDVIRQAMKDIEAKGLDISRHRLDKKMSEFLAEAKAQVFDEV